MTSPDRLSGLSSALLSDSSDRCRVLPRNVRSMVSGCTAVGPAFTFEFEPGDNLAVHRAVAAAPRGSVLVGACHEPAEVGVFGAILATAAHRAGLAGLVTDAFVRDREMLRAAGFPVFASGCAPRKATKQSPGRLQVTVTFGAQAVAPGDLVCADDDGIVTVPRDDVAIALAQAADSRALEETLIERVRSGETTLKVLGIDDDDA
jgi:4-hydroxy-4-methyl-2-oxoglutarate aldolase